jgi:hypothetical protein
VNIAGNVYALDILPLEAEAFYIMDRGCMDFARLYTMHQAGAFFVTRAKSNFNARRVYSATVDKTTGVVCDQWVALNGALRASRLPRAAAPGAIQRSNDGKDFDFSDQQHEKRSSNSNPRFTLVYRFCRCRFLRKPLFHGPCRPMTTKLNPYPTLSS